MPPDSQRARGRKLKTIISTYLSHPRSTPDYFVRPYGEPIVLGTPSGPHSPIHPAWIYTSRVGLGCMLFGFYEGRNGYGNDLICKVLDSPSDYVWGVGASLQLNADLNLQDDDDHVLVSHHGRVSRPRTINMDLLADLIQSSAPLAASRLQAVFTRKSWPFTLGSTKQPGQLIDRFFLYASCIQAAKDSFDALNADESESTTGQGYAADPVIRRVVEEYAMRIVEAHYRADGYEVDDVHKTPGMLDFKCTRSGTEILVEVKGTLSPGAAVELTAAEVNKASRRVPQVDLAVVSNIVVDRHQTPPAASGGRLHIYRRFNPKHHELVATKFRCTLDSARRQDS